MADPASYPDAAWPIRRFAVWWLRGKPFAPPADFMSVYRGGDAGLGLTLYRHGPFQVQLFIARPNVHFPRHRHPHIDSAEFHLAGFNEFKSERNQWLGPFLMVAPTEWHVAESGPEGSSFISIQKWLNGVAPTSVELDWEGDAIDDGHSQAIRPVYIQSRLHDADMAGYVMAEGGYVYLHLPMEYNGIGGTDG